MEEFEGADWVLDLRRAGRRREPARRAARGLPGPLPPGRRRVDHRRRRRPRRRARRGRPGGRPGGLARSPAPRRRVGGRSGPGVRGPLVVGRDQRLTASPGEGDPCGAGAVGPGGRGPARPAQRDMRFGLRIVWRIVHVERAQADIRFGPRIVWRIAHVEPARCDTGSAQTNVWRELHARHVVHRPTRSPPDVRGRRSPDQRRSPVPRTGCWSSGRQSGPHHDAGRPSRGNEPAESPA